MGAGTTVYGGGRGLSRREIIAGVGAATGLALGVPARANARPASADWKTTVHTFAPTWAQEWMQAVYDLTWRDTGGTALGTTPPNAARSYFYVTLAMYEACVGGMPGHRSLGGQLSGLGALPVPHGRIDWPVALASAALATTQAVYPDALTSLTAPLVALRDRQVADRRAAGVSGDIVARSSAHGRAVAAALAAWIATDGFAEINNRPYTPPVGEGLWESTPPNYRPAIEPYWAQIRPMVMRTSGEVRPVPHIPFSTVTGSAFWEQAMTPYRASQVLTDEQRAIARFWTDNPINSGLPSGHWLLVVSQVGSQHRLDLGALLEALVRTGAALHEAFLSCWTHKYEINLIRPITYIRRYVDPTWSTFINTPQFPEYTSGHSVSSMAAATVLTDLLGPLPVKDDSHRDRGMPARQFASFNDIALEAAQSRIYGGIHYPMAIENGKDHGREVGQIVIDRLHTRV